MLTYCPTKRISALDALNHCIFKKIQKNICSLNEKKIPKKFLENLGQVSIVKKHREATLTYLVLFLQLIKNS